MTEAGLNGKSAELDEAAFDERDERVRATLATIIAEQSELAERYEQDARDCRKLVRRIEQAVKAERWYELKGLIDREDIESLCNISPVDLLGSE